MGIWMVASSVAATAKIHGSSGSRQLPDDGAWEPVEIIGAKCAKDWQRLVVAQLALKRLKGYRSEIGRYLQHVKARTRELN